MRGPHTVGAFIVIVALSASCQGRPASSAADHAAIPGARELKVGDEAPGFSLPGSDGKTYRLADFKGRQAVVVAWFAKAFTSA